MKSLLCIILLSLFFNTACQELEPKKDIKSKDELVSFYHNWNRYIDTLNAIADVTMKMGKQKERNFNAHILSQKSSFFRMNAFSNFAGTVMEMLVDNTTIHFYNKMDKELTVIYFDKEIPDNYRIFSRHNLTNLLLGFDLEDSFLQMIDNDFERGLVVFGLFYNQKMIEQITIDGYTGLPLVRIILGEKSSREIIIKYKNFTKLSFEDGSKYDFPKTMTIESKKLDFYMEMTFDEDETYINESLPEEADKIKKDKDIKIIEPQKK